MMVMSTMINWMAMLRRLGIVAVGIVVGYCVGEWIVGGSCLCLTGVGAEARLAPILMSSRRTV